MVVTSTAVLVVLAFFWTAFSGVPEDLELVSAPATANDGDFYNCSKLNPSASATADVVAVAKQKCKDTVWCIWNLMTNECWYDKCLKYLTDTEVNCATGLSGFDCIPKYITDSYNCTNFTPIQIDRFCRQNSQPAVGTPIFEVGPVDECFYQDFSSIGSTATADAGSGTRKCSGNTCKWANGSSNVGATCAPGGQDCTLYNPDSDEYCQCLGVDNCDLYPRCMNSGSACILDPCWNPTITPPSQQHDVVCKRNDGGILSDVATCKGRIENYYDTTSSSLKQRVVCVSSSKAKPNECYYAVKSTTTTVTVPADTNFRGCDTTVYDESICSSAFTIKSDGTNDTTACSLVDIASGYVSGSKYCTDGDRNVPSPDSGFIVRLSSILMVLLIVVVSIL